MNKRVNTPDETSDVGYRPSAAVTDRSVPSLIMQLAEDLSTLVNNEVALAKSEVREAAEEAKAGVMAMAAGAILALAGVFILLLCCVYLLALVVPLWLSAFIVGGATLSSLPRAGAQNRTLDRCGSIIRFVHGPLLACTRDG